jgi:hypothetical protein
MPFAQTLLDLIYGPVMTWFLDKALDTTFSALIGGLASLVVSWYVLTRHRRRFQRGDSDDLIFSAHYLLPVPGSPDKLALLLRNPLPPSTVDKMYDNPAARELMSILAARTSIESPVLQTEGRLGFEVLNQVTNVVTGATAGNSFERKVWLCALTCEDRAVVRKRCLRVFLIRPDDLRRFADWDWCRRLYVERWWHHFRVYALHRIAQMYLKEEVDSRDGPGDLMPMVHDQARHRRVVAVSIGINPDETLVCNPAAIDWGKVATELKKLGATLPSPAPAEATSRPA